jgi:hypothetical protein
MARLVRAMTKGEMACSVPRLVLIAMTAMVEAGELGVTSANAAQTLAGSKLTLERGPNALWTQGGLICALPFRCPCDPNLPKC